MEPIAAAAGAGVEDRLSSLQALTVPMNTGAIVVRTEQMPRVEQAVASLDFRTMPPADILKLGFTAEQNLQRTLDGFLSRLDKKTASKVFALFGLLQKGVEDADLPTILEQVQRGAKPGILQRIIAFLTGKDPDELVRQIMDDVSALITGKTQTLTDEMQRLEKELSREMQALFGELQVIETLKRAYGVHFDEFTIDAASARALLEEARAVVAQEEASLVPTDVVAQGKLRDLKNKLTLLESRALALEGTYTRLPADQQVIQQLEAAGIGTLQETATTASSRFASIKMALLSIHAAFAIKGVQQLNQRFAKMDEQLIQLRGQATQDVAVAAAKAPGDNRLAQAEQIASIITMTRETGQLVKAAQAETEQKFEAARDLFMRSRDELAALSST